jgi:hypothetical protein
MYQKKDIYIAEKGSQVLRDSSRCGGTAGVWWYSKCLVVQQVWWYSRCVMVQQVCVGTAGVWWYSRCLCCQDQETTSKMQNYSYADTAKQGK